MVHRSTHWQCGRHYRHFIKGTWGSENTHKVCPGGIQPIRKIRHSLPFIDKDTRNIIHRTRTHQSPSPWDLTRFSQSPSGAPLCFPESHRWSEIYSLPKVILALEKARSHRVPNLGCSGTESPGWFDVSQKTSAGDVIHEQARCGDEAANHQLPIAAASWIIWVVSTEEWMFKFNAKFDSDSLALLANFECDGHTVHVLTQQHLPTPTD